MLLSATADMMPARPASIITIHTNLTNTNIFFDKFCRFKTELQCEEKIEP